MAKPRVLHCITVYNGRAFVPRAISSALRMDQSVADIDVLILDDASPEPGWSEELKAFCEAEGALYYLTPRNLGIPRNVTLGLKTALECGYDYVTINNSDVIFPRNLVTGMIEALTKNDNVGSVTAWSNNVSIYSVPNEDPDLHLADQSVVDWVSEVADKTFGGTVLDIPAGISFCIMMPISAVRTVGFMDPVYGRGYCEETDWSLRSLEMGLRLCLAPGVFVYHQGRGSNLDAGLVSAGHTTVPENEAIIDMRYPLFRAQVEAFFQADVMTWHRGKLIHELMDIAAQRDGLQIDLGWLSTLSDDKVTLHAEPQGDSTLLKLSRLGFTQSYATPTVDASKAITNRFGDCRVSIDVHDACSLHEELALAYKVTPKDLSCGYPSRV